MKNHYVYITTNLINGKQYVGDHTIQNKGGYYLGSGLIMENAFRKYGKQKCLEISECSCWNSIAAWAACSICCPADKSRLVITYNFWLIYFI